MSEFIRMYLTSLNSFVINIIIFIIFAVIGAVFLAKGRDNLMIFFFTSAIVVFFSSFIILSASHFEIESSARWAQFYPSKENVSKISLKFEDDSMSQKLDSNVLSDTLYSVKNYQDDRSSSLMTVTVIVKTKSGKEEQRKFYLSKDNKLPKEVNRDDVFIDKIEYREIDGVRRHLGSFYGNLEESDVRYELRITYKNDKSQSTVFE